MTAVTVVPPGGLGCVQVLKGTELKGGSTDIWRQSRGFPAHQVLGGGNSKIFGIFTLACGDMIQFDEHIFQMGWFNHQLELFGRSFFSTGGRNNQNFPALKINMEPKNGGLVQMIFLFNWVICRFHVNLPGCTSWWFRLYGRGILYTLTWFNHQLDFMDCPKTTVHF